MKKGIFLLLSLLMPVLVNASVYSSVDLSMDIDDSKFAVFTRENLDNNSLIEEYSIDKQTILDEMVKKNIYIEGYENEDLIKGLQFVVTIKDSNTEGNLSDYPKSQILTKTKIFREASNVTDSGVLNSKGYSFVYRTYRSSGLNASHFYEYYTVINGKDYNIYFSKKGSDFTDEEKNIFNDMIKTIKFNTKTSAFGGSIAYKLGYFIGALVVIVFFVVLVLKLIKPKKKN